MQNNNFLFIINAKVERKSASKYGLKHVVSRGTYLNGNYEASSCFTCIFPCRPAKSKHLHE